MILSFLMIVFSVADFALFAFKEASLLNPIIDILILVLGILLFRFVYLTALALDGVGETKEAAPVKDGWEYLGDHCWCPTRYREDRDFERERAAEAKAYWATHSPNQNKK